MKKQLLFFAVLFVIASIGNSQVNLSWARSLKSTTSETGRSITVDLLGNVYTVGSFSNTVDFDPGSGVYTITPIGANDIFISKLDVNGNFVWAKSIGGSGDDFAFAAITDLNGDLYFTGNFNGTVDFNPSALTYSMTGAGLNDIFICKLNSTGSFVWAKQYSGAGSGAGNGIAIDTYGFVFITGNFSNSTDFDPGVGVYTMSTTCNNANFDIFVSKMDTTGGFVWARSFHNGGCVSSIGQSIALDQWDNVYSIGSFNGTCDFDPGSGIYNLTSNSSSTSDIYISKLDALGNFLWAKAMGGTGNDIGLSIAVDQNYNVHTTGYFNGVSDFDPSAGVSNLTSVGLSDVFISKHNVNGDLKWVNQFGGTGDDKGNAICLDSLGNIYTTGTFTGTADFDPSATNYNLTALGVSGSTDFFLSKLDSLGSFNYAYRFGASGPDDSKSLFIDKNNNLFLTGSFIGNPSVDFDPSSGVYNIVSGGGTDVFVLKLCQTPSQPININGVSNICANSTTIFSVSPIIGATSYNWVLSSGLVGSSTTNSITVTAGISNGTISVSASNNCGTSAIKTLTISVSASPTIAVNSGSICVGQSFTINPIGAVTYTFSGGSSVVSPTTNTSYSVSGTNSVGCVSNSVAVSSVSVSALPVILVNSGSICAGASFTMNPSGANTYTFSSGSSIVSPLANASYSISGSNAAGCVSNSVAVSNVTVNPLPIITISTTNTLLCSGQSASLTAIGVNTYSWNTSSNNNMIVVSPTVNTTYTVSGSNANGCNNTAIFTQSVSTCTGITAIANNLEDVILYPNPIKDILKVSGNNMKKISITNNIGKSVKAIDVNNQIEININLEDISPGIYFVNITDESKNVSVKKIIKE